MTDVSIAIDKYIASPMNKQPKIPGFHAIRNRILLFSLLVTLVPSLAMGWFWFDLTRKATTAKIDQKLRDSAGSVQREINLWLKERNYELRVVSGSVVVIEALEQYYAARGGEGKKKAEGKTAERGDLAQALTKINTYLTLIKNQFSDYHRLLVLDEDGRIIAASDTPDRNRPVVLPADWKTQVARSHFFVGEVFKLEGDDSALLLIGAPLIIEQSRTQMGYFVMETRLQGLAPLLQANLPTALEDGEGSSISLWANGQSFAVTVPAAKDRQIPAMVTSELQVLFSNSLKLGEFHNDDQERMIGLAASFAELPWHVVVAENHRHVFAGLIKTRNRILLITFLLTIVIGAASVGVASRIIIPLEILTRGVLRVADGELDLILPVHRKDELGIVTGMFNDMVRRLQENQHKLEQIATTDSLTGLANRKQILADLTTQVENFRRYSSECSVLMIDIDHFKKINDGYGHLAGDAVLGQLASILRENLRSMDRAGRYGGEEFLVVLGKTDSSQAMQTAERIRQAVEGKVFSWEETRLRLTVSLGVATITASDLAGVDLIGRADKALYVAKAAGRNQAVFGTVDA